jgi:nucleolar protein 56
MKCYLTSCFAGFMVLDENCVLLDYELFSRDKIRDKINKIQDGNFTREEESLLKRAVRKCDVVIMESPKNISKYKNFKISSKFKFETPNKGGDFLRSNTADVLKKTGFLKSAVELRKILHDLSIEITEQRLKEASKSEDMLLIQAINAIEESGEATGKLRERIREWYALHFPELDRLKNHEKYIDLILEYGDSDSIIKSGALDPDLDIKESIGASIQEDDILMVQEFAASLKALLKSKKTLSKYVDKKMGEVAPNLMDLVGSSLGAKLIAHVGGIKRLSKLPSSTIQIMGAEKALFRHLKTGERPPKHGLIYQHPEVRGSRWWIRGKVARVLASKIAFAVRKDVFSGEYDPKIKESFDKKLKDIIKANPFPKRSKKSQYSKRKKKKLRKK